MRFVVAGGGFAGLAVALAVARAGHTAVVLERDAVGPEMPSDVAFDAERGGIPHFLQPHAFLPRGRRVLLEMAPDVHDALLEAGAESQDVSLSLKGPRLAGDEHLVYLWVRRPVIEWALRRAAAGEPGVELRPGVSVAGLVQEDGHAVGVGLAGGELVQGDVVVDALGRYRCPPGWPRADAVSEDSGSIYYSHYFRLADGAEHLPWPLLNPRGDLGYMGYNVFRGDNRTFAVILLTPAADRDMRILRHEAAWMAACAQMTPLDELTSPDHSTPITPVLPMGGLMNTDRTGDPGVRRVVAVGDSFCHTDPGFSYGLAFSLEHARCLAEAADEAPDDVAARYRHEMGAEARERHALACATGRARARRWGGETLDIGRRDGCYPLFSWAAALAAAPHDDLVLRRVIGRVGMLDRTSVFDEDADVHERIETIFAGLTPPTLGPPREELLAPIRGLALR